MTSGILWNNYRNKIDNVNHNASDGKSFKYKAKIIGKIEVRGNQHRETNHNDQINHQYRV